MEAAIAEQWIPTGGIPHVGFDETGEADGWH